VILTGGAERQLRCIPPSKPKEPRLLTIRAVALTGRLHLELSPPPSGTGPSRRSAKERPWHNAALRLDHLQDPLWGAVARQRWRRPINARGARVGPAGTRDGAKLPSERRWRYLCPLYHRDRLPRAAAVTAAFDPKQSFSKPWVLRPAAWGPDKDTGELMDGRAQSTCRD
jgi:hypothetical protein